MLDGLFLILTVSAGEMPVPEFELSQEDVRFALDQYYENGDLRYSYWIRNPESNTGDLESIDIRADVPHPHAWPSGRSDLTVHLPRGEVFYGFTLSGDSEYSNMDGLRGFTPLGTNVGPQWQTDISRRYVSFSVSGDGRITPGGEAGPLELRSPSPPGLREMIVMPYWVLVTEGGSVTREQHEKTKAVSEALRQELTVVAPYGVRPSSDVYLDKFLSDLEELSGLGWCESEFTCRVSAEVNALREDIGERRLEARVPLTDLIDSLPEADEVCSRSAGFALVRFGLEAMRGQLPDEEQ